MSMGISFGDVQYIKSEGHWKSGHLEETGREREGALGAESDVERTRLWPESRPEQKT